MAVSELLINAKSWSDIFVKSLNVDDSITVKNLNVENLNVVNTVNASKLNLSNQASFSYRSNGSTLSTLSAVATLVNLSPSVVTIFNNGNFIYSNGAITVPEDGYYYVNYMLVADRSSNPDPTLEFNYYGWVVKNSEILQYCYGTIRSDRTTFGILNNSAIIKCSANDILRFYFQQNTAFSVIIGSITSNESIFSIVKLF